MQSRLFILAALFLGLDALVLTLSPAARLRTWDVPLRWDHWGAYGLWLVVFAVVNQQSARRLPGRDPYLLPIVGLLTGWGTLVIWRLLPGFGLRQSLWLLVGASLLVLGMRLPSDLEFLRRYKYLWLTGGLLLTGLTLLLGTNPLGYGPRMWLGCCGFYLQPSEPLKLLLVIYLAAYLADRRTVQTWLDASGGVSTPLLPLLAPTLIMTGLALLLLVVQRDLGTAAIFVFLYTIIVYLSSGRKSVLLAGALAMATAVVLGTLLFSVVAVRVEAWLNPWVDPSGGSYQIVQSLLAVANGGLLGRGPGGGSPGLVPVPHSDFIFAAIAEESGLVGALALLVILALFAGRGLRIALRATRFYLRLLAAGLTTYLVAQAILIIGGNLRLLPLTGVTLPFVSYGGSSLVTSFISLLLLLHISNTGSQRPAPLPNPAPYRHLLGLLLSGLALSALVTGWWAFVRSPELTARTDDPRRGIADRFVPRGAILDRNNHPINVTSGQVGQLVRQNEYTPLSNVVGYNNLVYGQSGLEASLDPILRGREGYPTFVAWWNHLLYGQPPAGSDIRLSLDLNLQQVADEALVVNGALVLLNPQSGEVLAMSSHPSFNANQLEALWPELVVDDNAPLLNRATQGRYQPGPALGPLLLAAASSQGALPKLPEQLSARIDALQINCALPGPHPTWAEAVLAGCPAAQAVLAAQFNPSELLALYDRLGLYTAPQLRLPAEGGPRPDTLADPLAASLGLGGVSLSPLQMALAAASLSAHGVRPPPEIVQAANLPQGGWQRLAPLSEAVEVLPAHAADEVASELAAISASPVWQTLALVPTGSENGPVFFTWYLAGTAPEWQGSPRVLALVIEEDDPQLALNIGQHIMRAATRR